MSSSLSKVLFAEWRQLPQRMGGIPAISLYIAFLVILGYWVPSGLGFGFLDPHMVLMYCCSAPFFMMTVVTASFFDLREMAEPRTMLAGKLLATAGFGWGSSLLMLVTGLVTVNWKGGFGRVILPEAVLLLSTEAVGICLALLTASLGAVMSLGAGDEGMARARLRRLLLLSLLAVVVYARFGPVSWKDTVTEWLGTNVIWFALIACAVLVGLTALLVRSAARHPRYQSAVE